MAINDPDDDLPASDGGGEYADLPVRGSGAGYPVREEARAELRDRQTYYAELRHAVHCQTRSVPAASGCARVSPPDDWTFLPAPGTWEQTVARLRDDTWT